MPVKKGIIFFIELRLNSGKRQKTSIRLQKKLHKTALNFQAHSGKKRTGMDTLTPKD